MGDIIAWTNEKRKLSQLIPWKRNPRQIKRDQAERLQASLEEFGQPEVIAIGPDNSVYNGHQRLKAWADKYGDIEVDVRVSSRALTEKEREKLTIFLHKGAAGEWDFDILANEFEFGELVEWGFNEKELLGLDFGEEKPEDPGAQIDRAEELREKWQVETGQLWRIPSKTAKGEHRIICGDCTDRAVAERVMRGEKAICVFSDPPYGVSIGAKNRFLNSFQPSGRNLENLESDDAGEQDLRSMLLSAYSLAREIVMADNCSIFVCAPQGGSLGLMMMMMMMDAGLPVKHVLIWCKNAPTFSLGRLDYEYQHEPILFTWKKTHKRNKSGQFHTSIWDVNKPRSNAEHPTIKPIELVENAILNHTSENDIVFDNFLGSGTTIVACERRGRIGRGIEISPAYVAVSLQRLADMGLEPILEVS
jgi:DNA modification methylase